MSDTLSQTLAALRQRAGSIMGPLTPPTLDPNSAPSVETGPKPTALRILKGSGGGLSPSTLSAPNTETATQASVPLPNPADPKYNPPPKTGFWNRLAEVGMGALGGLPAAENYANGPRIKALQELGLDRQHALDQAGIEEKQNTLNTRANIAYMGDTTRAGIAENNNTTKRGIATEGYMDKDRNADAAIQSRDKIASDALAAHSSDVAATNASREAIAKDRVIAGPKPSAADEAISDHLAAQNLPNTPANRDQARTDILAGRTTTTTDARNAATTKSKASEAASSTETEFEKAQQFAAHPSPANDAGLLMTFIGVTKPENIGRIRFQMNELNFMKGLRSSYGDVQALVQKVQNGQLLTPEQRKDYLGAMKIVMDAEKRGGGQAPAATPPASGGLQIHRDASGRITGVE